MYQLVYLDKNGEDGVHVPLLAGGVSVESNCKATIR